MHLFSLSYPPPLSPLATIESNSSLLVLVLEFQFSPMHNHIMRFVETSMGFAIHTYHGYRVEDRPQHTDHLRNCVDHPLREGGVARFDYPIWLTRFSCKYPSDSPWQRGCLWYKIQMKLWGWRGAGRGHVKRFYVFGSMDIATNDEHSLSLSLCNSGSVCKAWDECVYSVLFAMWFCWKKLHNGWVEGRMMVLDGRWMRRFLSHWFSFMSGQS